MNLLNLLFPNRCIFCGQPVEPDAFWCARCGPLVHLFKGPVRLSGDARHLLFRNEAVMAYDSATRSAILSFKFHRRTSLARPLSRLLIRRYGETFSHQTPDLILPVPLHPKRLRERGYNQSALLAAPLAKAVGVPYREDLLLRVRNTPPQSSLQDRRERLTNLENAFRCTAPLHGEHVLLIDDVCTTGSTLVECARVLLEAGAGKVSALCVMHTLD